MGTSFVETQLSAITRASRNASEDVRDNLCPLGNLGIHHISVLFANFTGVLRKVGEDSRYGFWCVTLRSAGLLGMFVCLAIVSSASAQDCGQWNVVSWQGKYSLTASGTNVSSPDGWTVVSVSVSAAGNFSALATSCSADRAQWSGDFSGQGSFSVNAQHPCPVPPGGHVTQTGSVSGTSYGTVLLIVDLSKRTYSFLPLLQSSPFSGMDTDCSGTTTVVQIPFYTFYPDWDPSAWPSFPLPDSPQVLSKTISFQAPDASYGEPLSWTLTFTLAPARGWVRVWMSGGKTSQVTTSREPK
jgi:hypothetical protein